MAKSHKPDTPLLVISSLIVFTGILILAGVSASFSLQRFGSTFYFLNHQLLFGLLPGIALGATAYFFPLQFFKKTSFPLLLFTALLLLVVFFPIIGSHDQSAYRWIFLGPYSFQPSELLKLALILYIASWLSAQLEEKPQSKHIRSSEKKERRTTRPLAQRNWTSTLLPFGFILGVVSVLLVLQPDISTLGIVAATAVIMYFAAGTPFWHTLLLGTAGVAALFLLIQLAPYRLSRFLVFLNPNLDPLGQGYQIKQALIGIGSGGLTGVGLGLSFQKFGILPEPISDSIFAIFAEEVGFLGATLLVALFLAFALRGLVIARRQNNLFSKLTAIGIISWITMQAFVNMGSMVGVLPLTGIPLPFISYGGSALVVELIALGILLNISKRA